jgi:uncharacterized Zn finger protein
MAFWSWPKYVCKAEKKARAAKKLEKLKKKRDVKPVVLQGKAIARTWWGKAWNENLERYADYENRIGRGRSYVRHGAVLDLQVREGEIIALVQGSQSNPYEIIITVKKLNKDTWKAVTGSCLGMIDSLSELVEGKFPKSMAEIFMRQGTGLFPTPKEISLKCSCPDWASMCKHVAAALYGVGARLDEDPALFFTLRGVDTGELVSRTVSSKAESLLEKASKKSARIIADADLSSVFGIDIAGDADPPGAEVAVKMKRRTQGAGKAAGATRRRKTARSKGKTDARPKPGVKSKKPSSPKKGAVKKRAGAAKTATKRQDKGKEKV